MPQYCYTNDNGETIEKTFSLSETKPSSIIENDVVYKRDYTKETKQGAVDGKFNCWVKCKE